MLTIVEYNPDDPYRRRTGRVAKIPLNTREELGELRKGLFVYERDIDFKDTVIVDLMSLLDHCE